MRHPPLIHLPDNLALLRRVHWLHEASEAQLRGLVNGELGPPLEELTLEGGEMAVGQGQLNDAVYILKRGTLLVVNTPKNARKEVEVDQLLLGSSFNVLPFALTQPAANGIRAAGQVTLLKLPGPTLRALVSTSTMLEEALWNGVGKQAAEGVLANVGGLAKWQLERIANRLESHVVGGELEEVQFIKTAVVVLVSGAAAFTTAANTMIDWSKQPDRAWDVPYSCAPAQLKPPQSSSSTSPFFRVVLRPGSRFVAEEDSIHSRVRISHRRKAAVADIGNRALQLIRTTQAAGPGPGPGPGGRAEGLNARVRLLQLQLQGAGAADGSVLRSGGGAVWPQSGLGSRNKSVLQMQLAASRTMAVQRRDRKLGVARGAAGGMTGEAEGSTAAGATPPSVASLGWRSVALAARFGAVGGGRLGGGGWLTPVEEEGEHSGGGVGRALSRHQMSSWRDGTRRDLTWQEPTPMRREATRREATRREREMTIKGLHSGRKLTPTSDLRASSDSVAASSEAFRRCSTACCGGSLAHITSRRDLSGTLVAAVGPRRMLPRPANPSAGESAAPLKPLEA